jgi:hypothetical protein
MGNKNKPVTDTEQPPAATTPAGPDTQPDTTDPNTAPDQAETPDTEQPPAATTPADGADGEPQAEPEPDYVSAKTGGIAYEGQVLPFTRGQPVTDPLLLAHLKANNWPLMTAQRWAALNEE